MTTSHDSIGIDHNYIDLFGAIIAQAIEDYQTICPNGHDHNLYNSAKRYLFSKNTGSLEDIIERAGVNLDIEYIRQMANGRRYKRPSYYVAQETKEGHRHTFIT